MTFEDAMDRVFYLIDHPQKLAECLQSIYPQLRFTADYAYSADTFKLIPDEILSELTKLGGYVSNETIYLPLDFSRLIVDENVIDSVKDDPNFEIELLKSLTNEDLELRKIRRFFELVYKLYEINSGGEL